MMISRRKLVIRHVELFGQIHWRQHIHVGPWRLEPHKQVRVLFACP